MDEVKAPVPPDAWQRVWVSYDDEGFFSAPRTEAELRVYFEIAPGLVEQRQEGTTFENWVEECEHYGLLIPQRPDAPFLTLSWSRSDVAEILAGLILPDTDANIDAVISDGQTIDRLRDACTAAGHDVLLDGVERLAEADRLARHPVSTSTPRRMTCAAWPVGSPTTQAAPIAGGMPVRREWDHGTDTGSGRGHGERAARG